MMTRLKINQETLELTNFLEKLARVVVKDCFLDDTGETIYFVVEIGQLRKALGKDAQNVKRIQQKLGKKIRIIEFQNNVEKFVQNVIYPLKVEEVIQENGLVLVKESNRKTKSLLIGRGGKNIKLLNRAVKRFFSVNEVKIV